MLAQLCGLFLLFFTLFAAPHARAADEEFLDPEVAFKFAAQMVNPSTISVTFNVADGYYMYREHFKFEATGARLGTPNYPKGLVKYDTTFEKNVETYHHSLTVTIPVEGNGPFTLIAHGQGCSEKGLCYPPQEYRASLNAGGPAMSQAPGAPTAGANPLAPAAATAPLADTPPAADASSASSATSAAPSGDMGGIEAALKGRKLLLIIAMFVPLGLLLAFTPCVLPMVPILSSIIVGEGSGVRRSRSLLLSFTYVMGMAIVYTALGVAAGVLGEGLAARLQNPWVLGAFGLLMAVLSLSMFGFYELQVPGFLQTKLTSASNNQSAGKLPGVFVMGAISALIVGPCVAAPLAGVLLYISQTRDALVGGVALFSLAIGMGLPLLAIGASAGWLLPRAGGWMEAIKRFFGVMLLATAWWLVSPVLPGFVQMLGWTVLGMAYGMYLLSGTRHWSARALGLLFAVLGVIQLVGVVGGSRDPLAPLAQLHGAGAATESGLAFTRVKTVAQLDAALAQTGGKTAILDFYADWCVSCKEMEKSTFLAPEVNRKLANSVLLQVDVTANDDDDKALLKRFSLFGPPGIILFNGQGQEIADSRVIGYQDTAKFISSLGRLQ